MAKTLTPLSHCTEQETIEYMREGIRKAASYARLMAKAQKKNTWLRVARLLDEVSKRSELLAHAKPMSRTDTLLTLASEQRRSSKKIEKETKPKFIIN